ncbi:HemX family protein [Terribacillus aidingensis]|uniref:HemX family protein n=1 Tax=Terribacillus aidingensis TaxID=586416 RepID=A0A285NR81_9BACI|nr:cytochrome c biogenesis protein CcsA [Terribacillus aidingensis]SNZ11467.1 HemX family protein [Terribacillus aidingensis]
MQVPAYLYEIILVLYAASIFSYFIDFIQKNRKANQLAFRLLTLVWFFQSLFLLQEMISHGGLPVKDVYEGLYFYAWVLVSLSLFINRIYKVDFLTFFLNVVGFFMMLLYITSSAYERQWTRTIPFMNEVLIAHITLAILAYAFFTLSFVFAVMYVLQFQLLKQKKGYRFWTRLGDLGKLETYTFTSITIGTPLLLLSVIMGVVWAYTTAAVFYWYDWKTIGSLTVLAVYAVYLFLRLARGIRGKGLAIYTIAAFLILIINFFLLSTYSSFHFTG